MDNLDRYFARQENLAKSRTFTCPKCGSTGECLDRWRIPTSLVHAERAALAGWTDPYSLGA